MPPAPAACSSPLSIEEREERYRSLLAAARGLFPLVTLDDLVRHVLAHGPAILRSAACSLYLPEPKTRELVIYSARGEADAHVHSARIPWDRGIAGRVFRTRQAVCLEDARQDPDFLGDFDAKSGFQTRAVLCLPLVFKEECLGVIQAINPLRGGAFDDFDRTIMEGMAAMVTSAVMRLERDRQLKAMARLAGELAAAEEIQKALLPPAEVLLPNRRGLLLARYQPARTLGGDFYAVHQLPDGSILAALGDVSGKGIPAALTTAQVTTEIDSMAARFPGGLEEFVTLLNRHLCVRISAGRFIATTFLRYLPGPGRMEVVCAGQFAPWRRRDDWWGRVAVEAGLPLGVDPGAVFRAAEVPCAPGERWLLASDGITEGRNAAGREYGLERLEQSLDGADPYRQIEQIAETWRRFIVEDALHDDACLALFTCLPPPEIELLPSAVACKGCRSYIEQWARAAGFPDAERGKIVLAVDEAFTNLVRHAHPPDRAGGPIRVGGAFDQEELRFTLRTEAPFFDLARAEPKPIDWCCGLGGLGLHYIRGVFDRIESRPEGEILEITLIKRLGKAGEGAPLR